MITKYLKQFQQAEKLSGMSLSEEHEMLPYRHFNKAWIKADKPIKEIYNNSLKYSELIFYPNTNYKSWGVWILKELKLIKVSLKFNKLIGIRIIWPFTKPVYFPLRADIIYYRYHAAILVYTSTKQQYVIKIALTKWGRTVMKSEMQSQRIASSIKFNDVLIPSILKEVHNEHLYFTVESYFQGKRHSFKDKIKLETNYRKVFQFMLKLYLSQPIELQYVSESEFIGHDFVEEFISKQSNGIEILMIFKKLYAKNKSMILCRIHGDLSHNNILVNREAVCIIDWGKSKHHYLFWDMDNSSFNTIPVYEQFIQESNINPKDVYPYYEQLFLKIFIEMCRLIHNGIKRKTIGPELYSWLEIQNKKLLKICKELN